MRRSDVDQPDRSSVHQTWILRSAEVLLLDDGLLVAAGFGDLATRPPDHVCFAAGVHMRFGLPRDCALAERESAPPAMCGGHRRRGAAGTFVTTGTAHRWEQPTPDGGCT